MMLKKIGLILMLVFPMFVYSQNFISFSVYAVMTGDLKEYKNDPNKVIWNDYKGDVVIDFLNKKIKLGGLTFIITEKMSNEFGYVFRCFDSSNNENCKISYSHEGNYQLISLIRGGLLMSYINPYAGKKIIP